MKKAFKLILIMILALGALRSQATVLTNSEVKSIVAKRVTENCKKYTDAQTQVEVVALPFKDLDLPDGRVSFVVTPSADKFMPRDLVKVSAYVNGKLIRNFNAPVVVKAYQNVLVASCFLNREAAITQDVVTVQRLEISNILEYPLKEESLNKEMMTKKAFRQGEVIDRRFVKLRPDVLRNATVTVIFNSNNLVITTDAKALSDGTIGDDICIMNKNYNKIYTGKIIAENKVLVKI